MPGKSGSEILVSIIIPCYNPTHFLRETVDSVSAQTHQPTEVIIVNDGTDKPDACELLRSLAPRVTRCIDQANLGPAAARNTGFRAANGKYILPLDADDRLAPSFVAECVAALQAHPEAAFVYTDYRVFGDTRYVERLGDYNLHGLLDRNAIIYASLIRRADWELVGGYDESLRVNYEDWDFWLRLGERERFGYHLPRVLFHYRKGGRSLFALAREHDEELRERDPGQSSPLVFAGRPGANQSALGAGGLRARFPTRGETDHRRLGTCAGYRHTRGAGTVHGRCVPGPLLGYSRRSSRRGALCARGVGRERGGQAAGRRPLRLSKRALIGSQPPRTGRQSWTVRSHTASLPPGMVRPIGAPSQAFGQC